MAGAAQESKRGVLGGGGQIGEQQASDWAAPPEREGVECVSQSEAKRLSEWLGFN